MVTCRSTLSRTSLAFDAGGSSPTAKGPRGGDEAGPVAYNRRIGRTGRFGKTRSAITLVDCTDSAEVAMFGVIRRHYGAKIEELVLARDEDQLETILAEKDAKK